MLLANKTKGWTYKTVKRYTGPATSAEWILEAPSINNKTTRLATFQKVHFIKCRVNLKNPLMKPNNRGIMIQNNRVVSTPSFPNKSRDGFLVVYGSKMQISSKRIRRK
ncbi:G1 family glutamic endopeptidase [Paenibacillus cremeus]|uniref:G1 family glutamic endopeptidase n=1 Tax=Paenibacillus cremeus TaxID=2163881 RepID=UPI0037041B6D